jgi:hypothetical protein
MSASRRLSQRRSRVASLGWLHDRFKPHLKNGNRKSLARKCGVLVHLIDRGSGVVVDGATFRSPTAPTKGF